MNRITHCTGVLFLLLLTVSVFPVTASSGGPTDSVKPTLQGIMDVLTNPSYAGSERKDLRREKIMDVATEGFAFGEMSKLVLGKTWRKLDQQDRETFVQLFTKLLENAYVGKLEGFTGQTIEYKAERVKGAKAVVSTVVKSSQAPPLPVNYVMIRTADGDWQVYDIRIEGVSLLRNYKEQFKSILRKEKFEGLVKVIKKKNESFAKEATR